MKKKFQLWKNFSPESFFSSTMLTEFFLGNSLVVWWLVVGAFSARALAIILIATWKVTEWNSVSFEILLRLAKADKLYQTTPAAKT